jgi:hypothetical protein
MFPMFVLTVLIAALVFSLLGLFQVPGKVDWTAVAVMLIAVAKLVFTRGG